MSDLPWGERSARFRASIMNDLDDKFRAAMWRADARFAARSKDLDSAQGEKQGKAIQGAAAARARRALRAEQVEALVATRVRELLLGRPAPTGLAAIYLGQFEVAYFEELLFESKIMDRRKSRLPANQTRILRERSSDTRKTLRLLMAALGEPPGPTGGRATAV